VRRSGPPTSARGPSPLATARSGHCGRDPRRARGAAPLTRIVSALEQGGYLIREADPQDRRAVQVSATDRGTDLVVGLQSARSAGLRERIAALSPEERRRLEAALPALEALAGTDG
jgi:hypothetical protein